MAYVFRPVDAQQVNEWKEASSIKGWSESFKITGNRIDSITSQNDTKMGTSIPSPFARLFLFRGAFESIVSNPRNDSSLRLVSECLDMLEFLFLHGKDNDLTIRRWNKNEELPKLQNGPAGHKKWAKVLEDELLNKGELGELYLFFWKGKLIGGTSPYTLVFTSPNWVRKNQETFTRLDGSTLFDQRDPKSLIGRDDEFKKYICSLYLYLQNKGNFGHLKPFTDYIYKSYGNNQNNLVGDANNVGSAYLRITKTDPVINVDVEGMPICYQRIVPQNSDYEIDLETDKFKNFKSNNGIESLLALNETGLGRTAKYIGKTPWDSAKCKLEDAYLKTETDLSKRELPGNMGTHPYIYWGDLLEDNIIKLDSGDYDSQHFVTACWNNDKTKMVDSTYLLPLKKMFFEIFDVKDIKQPAKEGKSQKLVEVVESKSRVTVTIHIPVKAGEFIDLQRIYEGANIVKSDFTLGFFPFYRVTYNDSLNRYSIMTYGLGKETGLVVYKQNDTGLEQLSTIQKERTTKSSITSNTVYTSVEQGFDFVQINVNGVNGIVIPCMKLIENKGTTEHRFSVDFGTTNTYIAHWDNRDRDKDRRQIEKFVVDDSEGVCFFNKDCSKTAKSLAMREFAPLKGLEYPTRTGVIEQDDTKAEDVNLFGNMSASYYVFNENIYSGEQKFSYVPDLKWLFENAIGEDLNRKRVETYFTETLWMLKNKALLNGGNEEFKVDFTFPLSMVRRREIMESWETAKEKLKLKCSYNLNSNSSYEDYISYSESLTPYYCLRQPENLDGCDNYVNIDIGGGTHDILFVISEGGNKNRVYCFSAKFAANDIWGDGINVNPQNPPKDNGFKQYICEKYNSSDKILSTIIGKAKSSSDVMDYLFAKYGDGVQAKIKEDDAVGLRALLFIHFAAIMYNVARHIKKLGIGIPKKISFTGMGSKYTDMLGDKYELTKYLLEAYTGQKADEFKVIVSNENVKEITAKGLLEKSTNPDVSKGVNVKSDIFDAGFDTKDELTFGDAKNNDEIGKSLMDEFNSFCDTLTTTEFATTISNKCDNAMFPVDMISQLRSEGKNSLDSMRKKIDDRKANIKLSETMFFWPLKNALYELSKKYIPVSKENTKKK